VFQRDAIRAIGEIVQHREPVLRGHVVAGRGFALYRRQSISAPRFKVSSLLAKQKRSTFS
jgi:hypothetical protein